MTLNKINKNMIDPNFVQEVQDTTNKIGNLSELKTTNKTDIVKSVNEVTGQLAEKAKQSEVDQQLLSKRDKTTKITTNDIDKSSNANKIQLLDLSEEVQSAMAGTASVIGAVTDKSLTSLKYADESIIPTALSQDYNFKGNQVGVDVNTVIKSGIYFMTAASPNLPIATSMLVHTQRYGTRFVQVARRFDNPAISWVRGGDITNIANLTWKADIATNSILTEHIFPKAVTKEKINDKVIEATHLSATYDFKGILASVDLNTLKDRGLYVVTSSCTNLPKVGYHGITQYSFVLEVQPYGGRILQRARAINFPNEEYSRYTESGNFTGVGWVSGLRASMPLFGKSVVLMGDSLIDKGKQHVTIWERTGASTQKIGIGGTTMSNHGNSADYSKLSFYALAKAISTGVFTDQETAVANIYTSSSGTTDLNLWLTNFKAMDWNSVNYIHVRYGTNDHAMNNLIGTIGRTNFDTSTYIGAFNQGIKDILTRYPHIRIFVATPLWRHSANIGTGGDSDIIPNTNGDMLVDFVDALESAAKSNHLPFYDYYRHSGISAYTNTHYLSDQTHLNDAGSMLIGEIDSNFLTSH